SRPPAEPGQVLRGRRRDAFRKRPLRDAAASRHRARRSPHPPQQDPRSGALADRPEGRLFFPYGSGARSAAPRSRVAGRGVLAPRGARGAVRDDLRPGGPAPLHRGGPGGIRPRAGSRLSRRVPVHPRGLPVDVPGAPLDDAAVRRLRDRRGDQRALSLPPRSRPDRALHPLRHADADGPRLRCRPRPGGGRGEVGVEGVAIDTLDDMLTLFAGIDLGSVTTSMTINAPAAILLAFYVATAEEQGVPAERLGGTIQTDILKEYIAQKEWCFPIEPAMRLVGDMIEWCTGHMPRWHPISISGYHIREAGSTAQQELAFTLKDGFTYVEQAIERGLDVDDFAPRLSFFFNAHIDFFEEIAKYRAARRIWAREMRETYGGRREESWRRRFRTQTAGVSLTAQQPQVNIVRTAIEALAGVLGGTQSLHTNSYDEALALPTEDAVRIALRTQQVIAHETGVTNTID